VAAPLFPPDPRNRTHVLRPHIVVGEQTLMIDLLEIAAVPRSTLGAVVGSAAAIEYDLSLALDTLLFGP
jgi:hypothetical protein